MSSKVAMYEGNEGGLNEAMPDLFISIGKHYAGGSASNYAKLWIAKELALEFDEEDLMVLASHGIRYKVLN